MTPPRLQHAEDLSAILTLPSLPFWFLNAYSGSAQGFIDTIFTLMGVPLRCPDYTCISKRAKSVNVSFKTPSRGEIAHLVIDSTRLKVFGEGEWKVKKHGKEHRRWRLRHPVMPR